MRGVTGVTAESFARAKSLHKAKLDQALADAVAALDLSLLQPYTIGKDVYHGPLDESTSKGLALLRKRIERSHVPAPRFDEMLTSPSGTFVRLA